MFANTLRESTRYLRRTPLHPQWLLGTNETTARWIAAEASGRVLDIGCADRWVEPMLAPGMDYIAVDYPVTGKYLYGARPDIFADAGQLPLATASVDTALLLEVVEHLRHPNEALKEVTRVLKPKGRLLLTIPFIYPIHDAPHDYQRLTSHGLVRDIEAAGLRVDRLIPTLSSTETAGLLFCLAIGGALKRSIETRSLSIFLFPLLILAIPFVNIAAWLAAKILPSWDAIAAGYRLEASKL